MDTLYYYSTQKQLYDDLQTQQHTASQFTPDESRPELIPSNSLSNLFFKDIYNQDSPLSPATTISASTLPVRPPAINSNSNSNVLSILNGNNLLSTENKATPRCVTPLTLNLNPIFFPTPAEEFTDTINNTDKTTHYHNNKYHYQNQNQNQNQTNMLHYNGLFSYPQSRNNQNNVTSLQFNNNLLNVQKSNDIDSTSINVSSDDFITMKNDYNSDVTSESYLDEYNMVHNDNINKFNEELQFVDMVMKDKPMEIFTDVDNVNNLDQLNDLNKQIHLPIQLPSQKSSIIDNKLIDESSYKYSSGNFGINVNCAEIKGNFYDYIIANGNEKGENYNDDDNDDDNDNENENNGDEDTHNNTNNDTNSNKPINGDTDDENNYNYKGHSSEGDHYDFSSCDEGITNNGEQKKQVNKKMVKKYNYTTEIRNDKQFKCDKCTSSFTRKTRLTEHMNRVHLGKVFHFKCNQCGTRLSSKENLTRHSIVHTDKFKCKKCNRRFDRSYRFQRHLEKCNSSSH